MGRDSRESQDPKVDECPAKICLKGSRELDWEGNPFQITTHTVSLSDQHSHDTWAAPHGLIGVYFVRVLTRQLKPPRKDYGHAGKGGKSPIFQTQD